MVTKTKTKGRGASRTSDDDARYRIYYHVPMATELTEEFDLPPARPRWLDSSARSRVETLTQTVTGTKQMRAARAALREAGGVVTKVVKLGWFAW